MNRIHLPASLSVLLIAFSLFAAPAADAGTYDYFVGSHTELAEFDQFNEPFRQNRVSVNGGPIHTVERDGFGVGNADAYAELSGRANLNDGTLKNYALAEGNNALVSSVIAFGDTITLHGSQVNTPVEVALAVDGEIFTYGGLPATFQTVRGRVSVARGQILEAPEEGLGVEEGMIPPFAKPWDSFLSLDPADQLFDDLSILAEGLSSDLDGPVNDTIGGTFYANSIGDFKFQTAVFFQLLAQTGDIQSAWEADFFNTASLLISVPTGVSISSASGGSYFGTLSSPAPVVPEPSSLIMLGLSLTGVFFRKRLA